MWTRLCILQLVLSQASSRLRKKLCFNLTSLACATKCFPLFKLQVKSWPLESQQKCAVGFKQPRISPITLRIPEQLEQENLPLSTVLI